VNSVFLYGEINEEVYLLPPPGIKVQTLYGLKQEVNNGLLNLLLLFLLKESISLNMFMIIRYS